MSTPPLTPTGDGAGLEARLQALEKAIANQESFTYAVVHDLKSQLQVVLGFSNHLVMDRPDDFSPEVLEYLRIIDRYAARMERRVADLLALARLETSDQPLEIAAIDPSLRQAIDSMRDRIVEARVELEYWPAVHTAQVAAPASLVEILACNLIENSIKYADQKKLPPRIRIEERDLGHHACICVEDNGLGIEPEALEHLFDSGERHHARIASGTGLGLMIVKRIVTSLGGTVQVHSQPAEGTRFEILLPRAMPS